MSLVPFCKLLDPATYVACPWDLRTDAEGRRFWSDFFKQHIDTLVEQGVLAQVRRGADEGEARDRARRCAGRLRERIDAFDARPADAPRPVTILTYDRWRDGLLRDFGFPDPLMDLKARENERAAALLAGVCRRLDALPPRERLRSIIEGVFAGNLFDLGAKDTAERFLADDAPSFDATRARLKPRPWLIDDYEAIEARWLEGPAYRKAVVFIDNAGSDFVLGMVPLMRWLALRGTRVLLVANELATLNDMTIDDVRAWWPRLVEVEPSLAGLDIEPLSSGTGEPLIDLLGVSPRLNEAAADADLVILEGMGRGVETNLDARFSCDGLNIGMIKIPIVARRCGGQIYDLVCRFR